MQKLQTILNMHVHMMAEYTWWACNHEHKCGASPTEAWPARRQADSRSPDRADQCARSALTSLPLSNCGLNGSFIRELAAKSWPMLHHFAQKVSQTANLGPQQQQDWHWWFCSSLPGPLARSATHKFTWEQAGMSRMHVQEAYLEV